MAMLLYGFPPNVGATGTAALLNVPKVSRPNPVAMQMPVSAAQLSVAQRKPLQWLGMRTLNTQCCALQSLEALLKDLREAGYNLGHGDDAVDGEAIVRALQSQEDQRRILQGARGMTEG